MNQPTPHPIREDRPRKYARLPQMNKSNRLLRRYYLGSRVPVKAVERPMI